MDARKESGERVTEAGIKISVEKIEDFSKNDDKRKKKHKEQA